MDELGTLWNLFVIDPMLNGLVLLYHFLFSNFGLSIIVFTILIRFLMLPLTLKQLHMTKAMSLLTPKLQELQKRYANDKPRLSQETMKLYREHGVSPVGCLGPMVIQFPIWIGLYQAIITGLGNTPESLLSLSPHLYSWLPLTDQAVPLASRFLWLDLGRPDPLPVMPILVAASTWLQQKMMTLPSADPKQASMNSTMLWMMPAMFGFFTFSFPSGLALYWITSNAIGIVMQYFITGWGGLITGWGGLITGWGGLFGSTSAVAPEKKEPEKKLETSPTSPQLAAATEKKGTEDAKPRSKRKNRGRSRRNRPQAAGGEPKPGGDRSPEPG